MSHSQASEEASVVVLQCGLHGAYAVNFQQSVFKEK